MSLRGVGLGVVWWLGAVASCVAPVVVNPYPVQQWAALATGAGVRVAVVDSGVEATLPQLTGRVAAGRDLLPGRARCAGHGTAVAAAIVAVAPGVTIVPVRVSDGDPADADGAGRVADGIRWAAGHTSVINISLVVGVDDPRMRAAVAYAVRRGVVVVAAAGNDPSRPVTYPAAYPGVIGVGAVLSSGAPASFSPDGPAVDLVAAGDAGTSVAAGFVSGAVALVRERFLGLPGAAVADRLVATSDRARRLNPYRALAEGGSRSAAPLAVSPAIRTGSAYAAGDVPARSRSLRFVAVVLGLGAAATVTGVSVARGRRRGWRPGR
ncbi:S8 family serine peptidase [Actinoplanes sp. NPDC020271]|uniref:S8 family serine peptidase n=1 Tax=Actinoplanes sp. NPDC020271 TaxID=3363896 RepID=UPI0037AAE386